MLHICQEDIAVDVGDNHIKRTFAFQRGGIALGYGNIVHSIQFYIFEGVAHTPFIYVDSCTRGGSTHACQYGKDGSPTTHIEQCFALQVTIQQFAYDEACCLVVPCAECHLRIDDDVIFCLWDIVVKSAVNDTTVSDNDGLEEVLLPFLVPVFVFGFYEIIFYLCIGQREVCKCFFE